MSEDFDFGSPQIETRTALNSVEEELIESDAEKYAQLVIRELNDKYSELVVTTKWDEKAIEQLNAAIKSILQKQFREYRSAIIQRVNYHISSILYGVDKLQPLMDDKNITEIEIVAYNRIYAVDFKGRRLTDIKFESEEELEAFVQRLVDRSGMNLSAENPIVDFALPNRTRVNIVGKWVSVKRTPYVTMRKPPTAVRQVTKKELLEWGAFNEDMLELMQLNSDAKMNVLLSGETNSGKTTIIRMLMDLIDPTRMERVILLQDTPEIDPDTDDKIFVLLQTIDRKQNPITYNELLKSTLRMNPDRTWIGEVRGKEAAEMIESNLAGARGTLATGHSDSPENMIMRLVIMMYRAGFDFGEHIIRQIIHQSIDWIYQTRIMPDGSKKIVQIAEILPLDVKEGGPTGIRTIYEYQLRGVKRDEKGKIIGLVGDHKLVNKISNFRRKKMLMFGVEIPEKFGGAPEWN